MADKVGSSLDDELKAAKERLAASKRRTDSLTDGIEKGNEALRQLIESYREADDLYDRSRKHT